ncbi:two-component system sensor histidine kinase NtrB [Hyphococcus sp. DH-69]|uniref:two-component system sensor histidine kinase NtrB n=1 Tax=Hyphococcus formosus TaxID=3143534 RepID=UPI00398B77AB
MSASNATNEDEALRRYKDLILAASGDGIYGLDTEGNTLFVNPAALQLTGFEKDEVIGRSVHYLIHHSHANGSNYSHLDCPVHAAFKDGKVHHVDDEVFWRKDGSSFPVEYISTPIWDEGALVGAVVSFRDITKRKEFEAALHDSEQRAYALQSELHHVSRLGAMGEMASNIAHELNQPLAAAINYTQAARKVIQSDGAFDERGIAEILDKAIQQSKRAAEIIRGLRSFVSKDSSTKILVDINEIIEDAIELTMYGNLAARSQVQYIPVAPDVSIMVDKIRIQQVIVNLVKNSLDALGSVSDAEIIVQTRCVEQNLEISVSDNGPGIPEEIRNSVFRPFVTTKADGMGVGLSISKSIIEEHFGKLTVSDNPDRGVMFKATLPLSDDAIPAE